MTVAKFLQAKRSKSALRLNLMEDLAILMFCIAYTLCTVYVLKPNLMSGETVIASYSKSFSLLKVTYSVLIVLVIKHITYTLVDRKRTVTYYLIRILFFLYEIPVVLSFGLFWYAHSLAFLIAEVMYWLFFCLLIKIANVFKRNEIKLKSSVNLQLVFKIAILSVVVVGLLYSFRTLGVTSFSLSLSGIYRIRASFKENANQVITFFKTAFGLFICPCLITYYSSKRKYGLTLAAVILELLFYSMARDKTYLFLLPISLIIGLFKGAAVQKFDLWLQRGYLLYTGVLFFTCIKKIPNTFYELITRRIQVMPAFFNYVYFDYFSSHSPIWWRQDTFFIDKFFPDVYSRSVPLQISHVYFADLEGNPNAGMFAEAISRCGYLGIVLYPILLTLALCVIERIFHRARTEVKLVFACCLSLSMSNDVVTSTSFVIAMIIVCAVSPFFMEKNVLQGSN